MDECKNRDKRALEWKETDSHSVDENDGCEAAWNILKPQLAPNNWTVSESSTYYGFFSWGWQECQSEIDALKQRLDSMISLKDSLARTVNDDDIEIDALKAENEKLRKDAERYLWLRENRMVSLLVIFFGNGCINRDIKEVDAAIDAAMTPDTKGE